MPARKKKEPEEVVQPPTKVVKRQKTTEPVVPVVPVVPVDAVIEPPKPVKKVVKRASKPQEPNNPVQDLSKLQTKVTVNKQDKVAHTVDSFFPTQTTSMEYSDPQAYTSISFGLPITNHEPPLHEKEMVSEIAKSISSLSLQREAAIPSNTVLETKEKINNKEFFLFYDLERKMQGDPRLISNGKLTVQETQQVLSNIRKLDVEGMRVIFVIMRMYSVMYKESKMFDLPFKGKVLKENSGQYDIQFDLKDLPLKLQLMVLEFTNQHLTNVQNILTR